LKRIDDDEEERQRLEGDSGFVLSDASVVFGRREALEDGGLG
jgi:hypothetical protein